MNHKQSEITDSNYIHLFNDKIRDKFNMNYSPQSLIEIWAEIFEDCEYGYAHSIFELDDDMSIRNKIEFALNDKDLMKFTDHVFFTNQIEKIDKEFEKIINKSNDNGKFWWKNFVLKYARNEYVEQMKLFRNIAVEELK